MSKLDEAVAGLLDAIAQPPERNDLGRLARMHSWCQDLEDPDGGGSDPLRGFARAVRVLLERLILDEAAHPDAGVALLPRAVQALEALHRNEPLDATPLLAEIMVASGTAPGTPGALPATEPAATSPPAPAPVAAHTPPPAAAPVRAAPPPPPTGLRPAAPAAAPAATPEAPQPAAAEDEVEEYVSEPLLIDLNEKEHLVGFLDEAAEHMDAIEAGLLEVEADPTDTGKINELFRPFHTIKGIAGFLNLRDINRLTHEIETILDLGRKGELRITAGTVDLIFGSVDVLKTQLNAIRSYLAAPGDGPCPQPDITAIMRRLRRAARGQVGESGAPRAAGAATVGAAAARSEDRDGAAEGGAGRAGGKAVLDQSIRVDTAKLDMLVDAVGELVIAQSMVSLSDTIRSDDKLLRNVAQVSKIVRDVQETAMAMRMVPIGQTFQKMRRLVRDVSRKAGKQVELTINGEDTELDKNVIQQISDPLVHMVRNAVDHGIEPPAERLAAGKPAVGTVTLDAYHQGDSIVIEIRDDGRGLDPQKLIAKAIERGMLQPGETLSDQQAFGLILAPGFSTAEQVTEISGRGVGMDVVRRNVEQLRGKIEILSEKGRGSTFRIRLPLTLAIIDGMIVRVGTERLIIPTILIEQSLRPEPRQITTVQQRGAMLQVRGELCPLIQLGVLFDYGPAIDPCGNLVVIVQCGGQKIALVVEELIGQQQVVIKTLGERFKKVQGVSGAAILGDGRVGLILEPSGLLALHNERGGGLYEHSRTAAAGAPGGAAAGQTTWTDSGSEAPVEPVLASV